MENKDAMAFPFYEPGSGFGSVSPGVTKLEFFACNAPVDIPSFFVHVPPVKEVTAIPRWQDINIESDRELIKVWLSDGCDLPDHLLWYSEQWKKHTQDDQDFRYADMAARYFQWRRYYAEHLLSELSKTQP